MEKLDESTKQHLWHNPCKMKLENIIYKEQYG